MKRVLLLLALLISGVSYADIASTKYVDVSVAVKQDRLIPGTNITINGDIISAIDTNTTYNTGNATTLGLTKLYSGSGSAADGGMTQNAITTALDNLQDILPMATRPGSGKHELVWNGVDGQFIFKVLCDVGYYRVSDTCQYCDKVSFNKIDTESVSHGTRSRSNTCTAVKVGKTKCECSDHSYGEWSYTCDANYEVNSNSCVACSSKNTTETQEVTGGTRSRSVTYSSVAGGACTPSYGSWSYSCGAGYYYASGESCTAVGNGYYSPEANNTRYACATEVGELYTSSDGNRGGKADCYRSCASSDVDGSTSVSGSYHQNGTNTCVATACSANRYLSGTSCTACPSGYPNSGAGSTAITSCYSNTKSRAWSGSQTACATPDGCSDKTCNSCSGSACDYVAYSNANGNGDGTIKSGCETNNASCQQTVKSVTAKANYYASGTSCTACPSGYPNSGAGSTAITSCYSGTKSRAWTGSQTACSAPNGCSDATCNSCSGSACDYVAYSNANGNGDGTIKSGCSTNNASCQQTVKSVTAKAGYYAGSTATSCTACPSGYPNSGAGSTAITSCYSNTKSRAWSGSETACSAPTGCSSATCNSCSNAACNYVAYSNANGNGDGTIKSGCSTNNASCQQTVKSVTAKAGYYAGSTATSCTACPSGYPSSDAGVSAITSCYTTKTASCTQNNGSTPTNCYSVTAWNSCSCTGSTYRQYSNSAGNGNGTTSGTTSESCTKTPKTVTAKSGYRVDGVTCPACPTAYPNSANGNSGGYTACYTTKTASCTQNNGSTPTNCYSVTAWNSCSCTGSTYTQYANSAGTGNGSTSGTTSESCNKTPKTVTAKSGYYVSGATCPACSGLASGFYPNSADGNSGGASACYTNSISGQYVASANASSATSCSAGTYKASHTVTYGNTSSCSSCSNKPSNSSYTGSATSNACPWSCNSGYYNVGGTCQVSANCSAGTFMWWWAGDGRTNCEACHAGYYCPGGVNVNQSGSVGSTNVAGVVPIYSCPSGYTFSTGFASRAEDCYKSCTKTCSGNATSSCPANATCSYNTGYYTTGTEYYGGSCSASASSCPVSSWSCNANYEKSGSSCVACSTKNTTQTENVTGGTRSRSVTYSSSAGGSCTASYGIWQYSCGKGYYYSSGESCTAVGDGYYSPAANNIRYSCTSQVGSAYTESDGERASANDCYKSCTKTCSGNATSSCPAHATCSYYIGFYTSGYEHYQGSCSAAASSCPVSSWSCNANYYKDGSSCTACNVSFTNDGYDACSITNAASASKYFTQTCYHQTSAAGATASSQCTGTQSCGTKSYGTCYVSTCNTGYYGTAGSSTSCTACSNKPSNSYYTGSSTSNSCPYSCNSGYSGTSCSCTTPCTSVSNTSSTQACTPSNSVANAKTTSCSQGTQTCNGNYNNSACSSASEACSGCSSWGSCSTSCVATSCNEGYYLSGGACYAQSSLGSDYYCPAGNKGAGECYKSCTKTCSGNATGSCPANATCSYNTSYYTTGTQYYGGSCSAAASSCPVSSWSCNSGYIFLEYIESTGTQYIDLPHAFRDTDEMGARVTMMYPSDEAVQVMDKYFVAPSQWNNRGGNRFALGGLHYDCYTFAYGNVATGKTLFRPTVHKDMLPHFYTYKNHMFKMEDLGLFSDVSDIGFAGETTNLKLFYGYNAPTKCRIYTYYHIRGGYLMNLVPAKRNSDGAIGMYDQANNKFYGNSGGGTFVAGPELGCEN